MFGLKPVTRLQEMARFPATRQDFLRTRAGVRTRAYGGSYPRLQVFGRFPATRAVFRNGRTERTTGTVVHYAVSSHTRARACRRWLNTDGSRRRSE